MRAIDTHLAAREGPTFKVGGLVAPLVRTEL